MSTRIYTGNIAKVKFGIYGDKDIIDASYITVQNHEIMNGRETYPEGIYDPHLGTTDYSYNCETCLNNKDECPGHNGDLPIKYPILHPIFLQEIKQFLRIVCFKCGAIVVPKSEYEKLPPKSRLLDTAKSAKNMARSCPICAAVHPNITKDKENPQMVLIKHQDGGMEKLYPHMIKEIFGRVKDDAIVALGLPLSSKPQNLVLSVVPISAVTIRPHSRKVYGSQIESDDLTNLTRELVELNEKLPAIIGDQMGPDVEKLVYRLGDLYTAIVKGTKGRQQIMSKSGPAKSIAERHKGKFGRYRRNLLGKRVMGVARSVISGNVNLKIDEIGIPIKFAKILQIKETVQEYNKDRLMINFLNGPVKYPGATIVYKTKLKDKKKIDHNNPNPIVLEIGDVLHRDIQNGDIICFNRQPSLLPSNISAFRAVVLEDPNIHTLQMNVLACKLFNADFDGDAMNIFLASGIGAICEVSQLSAVHNWYIKQATGTPIIGQADDSIIGSFLLTLNGVNFNRYYAMMLYSNCINSPILRPGNIFSNRELVSNILKQTPVTYTGATTYYDESLDPIIGYDRNDIKVVIENGEHKSGVLDKKTIGSGSEFHRLIAGEYGTKKVLELMYDLQQMAIFYLGVHGITIGIMDLLINNHAKEMIKEIQGKIILESKRITEKLNRGVLIPRAGESIEKYYEELQIETLKILDDFRGVVDESINHRNNNLRLLSISGSKGTAGNLVHITAGIGQLIINGKRPPLTFDYQRSLPYYVRFDKSPESRGFIINSYLVGQTMPEVIFNCQNARNDMIAKALSTALTGEERRKSVKTLESIICNYLRASTKSDNIVSYLYGENGLDTRRIIKVKIPFLKMSDEKFKSEYKSDKFEAEFKKLAEFRAILRAQALKIETFSNDLLSEERFLAVDVARLVNDTIRSNPDVKPSDQELAEMVAMVDKYCEELPYIFSNETWRAAKGKIPESYKYGVKMLEGTIRANLYSKGPLSKLNKALVEQVLIRATNIQMAALIDYGATVGLIAAMSFSEPFVQYMLDAHHRSAAGGGTSKTVVTELKETFGARPLDKLENPHMTLRVKGDIASSRSKVQDLANSIEALSLIEFVDIAEVFFEKFGAPIHSEFVHEKAMIENFVKNNPILKPPGDLVKWCIRFTINKSKLIYKSISIDYIITKLRDQYADLYFVYVPDNSKEIIVRIYARNIRFKTVDRVAIEELMHQLISTTVRGIPGIKSAQVVPLIGHEVKQDGSIDKIKDKFCIRTSGTNVAIAALINEVDIYSSCTDAIPEIQKIFGIEAAKAKLTSNIKNLGAGGLNYTHADLYACEMTRTGTVTSIERYGVNKRDPNSIFQRIGFASPLKTLEEAAFHGLTDEIHGITGPLLLGDVPRVGTGYTKVIINEEFLAKSVTKVDSLLDNL
jgi:DNA-directed RNA polymerase II subunit RPB1